MFRTVCIFCPILVWDYGISHTRMGILYAYGAPNELYKLIKAAYIGNYTIGWNICGLTMWITSYAVLLIIKGVVM